jgi:capsular exopolysaccharide synthesis family protein
MSGNSNMNVTPTKADQPENLWAISPKEFIFKYLKYLPWIIICVAVGFVMAYLKLRYATPIYSVQSSLLIKSEEANSIGKDQKFDELMMSEGSNVNLSNETAILRSRPVLKRVIRDLRLQTYCYNLGNVRNSFIYPFSRSPIRISDASLIDSARGFDLQVTMLDEDHFSLNEDKKKYTFGQVFTYDGQNLILERDKMVDYREFSRPKFLIGWQPIESATENLIGSLSVVQTNDQATILSLSFKHENTFLGLDVLNTLMSVYDSLIVEDKTRVAIATENFIDTRLASLKTDLNGIEGNLKSDIEKNQTFDLEDQSKKYLDNIAESEKSLVESNVRLRLAQMLDDYLSGKENAYRLVPTSMGIDEPVLLQLVTEYNKAQLEREANLRTTTRENPSIKSADATLEKMRANIREALNSIKNGYKVAINSAQQAEDQVRGQLNTLPGKSMQLLNVQRQQKILEELYSFLLQKKIESSISSVSSFSNSKVLEPALAAGNPISPDRKKTYSSYLMLGLMLPIGIIALFEVMRDKVTSRTEVEKRTNAPILGEIGHSEESKSALVVTRNSRSLIAEQFRIIRTNLQYVTGRGSTSSILVTSSFSGEGKSFVSTNIGAVLALSGKKTVIMEFDIRKPKIVAGLELKRKMGITNYIIGKASFNDLLVKVDGIDNLYVIPCGPIPPNPAEILLDKKLEELMQEVKEHFEVVIMDTAPVGLVSDALSLGRFADCTLYVIRHGYTFRKQLLPIDELYKEKKMPSLSLLLNDVKAGSGYYSGYGYYGTGYGYGYGRDSGYFDDPNGKKTANPFKMISNWWKRTTG